VSLVVGKCVRKWEILDDQASFGGGKGNKILAV
jgi:hypothetical protein